MAATARRRKALNKMLSQLYPSNPVGQTQTLFSIICGHKRCLGGLLQPRYAIPAYFKPTIRKSDSLKYLLFQFYLPHLTSYKKLSASSQAYYNYNPAMSTNNMNEPNHPPPSYSTLDSTSNTISNPSTYTTPSPPPYTTSALPPYTTSAPHVQNRPSPFSTHIEYVPSSPSLIHASIHSAYRTYASNDIESGLNTEVTPPDRSLEAYQTHQTSTAQNLLGIDMASDLTSDEQRGMCLLAGLLCWCVFFTSIFLFVILVRYYRD
jgi:hypothetical protein